MTALWEAWTTLAPEQQWGSVLCIGSVAGLFVGMVVDAHRG